MAMPKWAQDLVIQVCLKYDKEDLPEIVWHQAEKLQSSGRAWYDKNKIVITAGHNRIDQKLVLLHELSHLLVRGHHSAHFWDVAWELYRWARLPILATKKREGEYRKGALLAYSRSRRGKEG